MITLKRFTEQSHVPVGLIRAVVRQVGGLDSFKEMAQDVCNHGADGGFRGFIYYKDTVAFTQQNKAAILELAESMAREFGTDLISLVAGFNCLKGYEFGDVGGGIYNPRHPEKTTVFNALAWFALEEVCRSFCDLEGE